MKTRLTRFLAVALLLFIVAPAFAQLPEKLAQFKNISGIKKLEVSEKMENHLCFVMQILPVTRFLPFSSPARSTCALTAVTQS